jgi:hypothetical protein
MATKCLCCFSEEKHRVWVVETLKAGLGLYDVVTDIIFYATLTDDQQDSPVGKAALAFTVIGMIVFAFFLLLKSCHMCSRMDDEDYEGAIPTSRGWRLNCFNTTGSVLTFLLEDIPQLTIVLVIKNGEFDVPAVLSLVGIIFSLFINSCSVLCCVCCFGCMKGKGAADKAQDNVSLSKVKRHAGMKVKD